MCMFCTAIPAAATAGIALNAKQKREKKEALAEGKSYKREMPIKSLTFIAVGSLVAASVLSHKILYS